MEYAICYGLVLTGNVITGPNEGHAHKDTHQELPDARSIEDAVRHVEKYRGKFIGRCMVFSRQWHTTKPDPLSVHQRWVSARRQRGGVLYTYNLATVTLDQV